MTERLDQFLRAEQVRVRRLSVAPSRSLEAAFVASGEAPETCLRASLLIDLQGVLMVIHSIADQIDPDAVAALTGRHPQPLTAAQADRLFAGCAPGFHPLFGAGSNVDVVVDSAVLALPRAVMTSGSSDSLLVLAGDDLRRLLAGANAAPLTIHGSGDQTPSSLTLQNVAEQLQKLYRLPPMPALGLKVMKLTENPESTAWELAELVEMDPSLSAQILRYARSALFNYQGQIQSVQEAVTRVLGFDRVAHVALGVTSVRAFDVPREGMLGLDAFWRHSLYCAHLCQHLAPIVGIDKGLAYLCGLLHNFGVLLIGHLFPAEFEKLNRLRQANPELSMEALERQVFGQDSEQPLLAVGHGAIGGILHRLWELPDAVVKAAGMHQGAYQGEHERYVQTVQLANEVLKPHQIGDEFEPQAPEPLLQSLGLAPTVLEELHGLVENAGPELDPLAGALSG